jgi:hypothetical protein
VAGAYRRLHNEDLHHCMLHCIVLWWLSQGGCKMGRACSMHGRDEKCIQTLYHETWRGRDHVKDLGIDGWIILECILGK